MKTDDYKRYGYDTDVGLIGRTEQLIDHIDSKLDNININTDDIKNTIKESVDDSMQTVNCNIKHVNYHIENAKNEIINNITCGSTCTCNLATKDDIDKAVCNINNHVDEKFNEIDFLKQFSDLNEQIKEAIK